MKTIYVWNILVLNKNKEEQTLTFKMFERDKKEVIIWFKRAKKQYELLDLTVVDKFNF